jgi:hypothetical protein
MYVVEMKHRLTGQIKYLGSVEVGVGCDGKTIDHELTMVDTFAEAQEVSFPDETAAAACVGLMPTKNVDYRVVPIHTNGCKHAAGA